MTEASQDKTLQKKLVGAAVLIALAVIFLPMLFDGKKEEEPVNMQISIPPKPVYDIPNRLENANTSTQTATPVETIELAPQRTESQPVTEPAKKAESFPTDTNRSNMVVESVTPTQEAAAEEKKVVEKAKSVKPAPPVAAATKRIAKPETPKPAPKAKPAAGAGYVVQVGSFSQQGNAEKLSSKLAAEGFPAFVERTDVGGRSIFRVKVGPRPTREAADVLRQRLIDKQRLEGIIVSQH